MNTRRLKFHEVLVEILGSRNVYFQPPSSIQMTYPCIVYSRSKIVSHHANNRKYNNKINYSVTVINSKTDTSIIEKILELPLCKFSKHYTADNLNHDLFDVYY